MQDFFAREILISRANSRTTMRLELKVIDSKESFMIIINMSLQRISLRLAMI
jgi:hypothetical protein